MNICTIRNNLLDTIHDKQAELNVTRLKHRSVKDVESFKALSDVMALRSNIQTLESVLAELKKILKDVDVLVDVFLKPKR
jgi:hypothetical protein